MTQATRPETAPTTSSEIAAAAGTKHTNELVRLTNVVKRFGDALPAIDHVSGSIKAGEITGLVGPDGAGKTTLIRMLTGLMLPDAGAIEVFGTDTRKMPGTIQGRIGYMPQRFGLYEDLSVRENLELYADLRGLPKPERPKVFEELLRFTDLRRFTDRLAGRLSGGMKQKLGLACALLRKPSLLLLDEPGVGVDPISRRDLWKMVQDLIHEGIAVVWSTAYLEEAEACDRVLLLNGGKLLFYGPPAELTERTKGRVFKLAGIDRRRRLVLAEALESPVVVDGVIQGEAIRLVAASNTPPPSVIGGPVARIAPTDPRFEDAFVDMLGGRPSGHSKLAEAARPSMADDMHPVIEARGLTKRFGENILTLERVENNYA